MTIHVTHFRNHIFSLDCLADEKEDKMYISVNVWSWTKSLKYQEKSAPRLVCFITMPCFGSLQRQLIHTVTVPSNKFALSYLPNLRMFFLTNCFTDILPELNIDGLEELDDISTLFTYREFTAEKVLREVHRPDGRQASSWKIKVSIPSRAPEILDH